MRIQTIMQLLKMENKNSSNFPYNGIYAKNFPCIVLLNFTITVLYSLPTTSQK